jgi:hypothetical protein
VQQKAASKKLTSYRKRLLESVKERFGEVAPASRAD